MNLKIPFTDHVALSFATSLRNHRYLTAPVPEPWERLSL